MTAAHDPHHEPRIIDFGGMARNGMSGGFDQESAAAQHAMITRSAGPAS